MVCVHTMDYYSALKKKETLTHYKCLNHEDIRVKELSLRYVAYKKADMYDVTNKTNHGDRK